MNARSPAGRFAIQSGMGPAGGSGRGTPGLRAIRMNSRMKSAVGRELLRSSSAQYELPRASSQRSQSKQVR